LLRDIVGYWVQGNRWKYASRYTIEIGRYYWIFDIRCAILLDIGLLIYWQSGRYKIEAPYLAALRLGVKYASRNNIEIRLRRNIFWDTGGYSLSDIYGYWFSNLQGNR
jgi:hypothetical protein